MSRSKPLFAAASFGTLLAVAIEQPAHAQGAVDPQGSVTEVVVTAQRRSEAAQNVPLAITALSSETLAAANVSSFPDIARLTPGLQFQGTGASQNSFLRGVGATTAAAGQEAGVALFVDDVYYSASPAAMMSLNNIASVVVLRGPQGTLFGRNASGGVIQITSRTPGQTPVLDALLSYGNHDTKEANVYAAGPLNSWMAADIAIYARNVDGGWGTNIATGEKVYKTYDRAVRSRWEFEVSPNTQATVIGQYLRIKTQHGFASGGLHPGELGQNERYLGGVIAPEGFWDVDLDAYGGATTEMSGASVRVVHDFGFAEGRSITSWNRNVYEGFVDGDFTRAYLQFSNIRPRQVTYTQEFQLASNADTDSPLKWVAGAYFFRDEAGYNNQRTTVVGSFDQYLNDLQTTDSWSVFAQGDYNLTDATKITMGIRYNEDRRRFDGTLRVVPLVGAETLRRVTGERTFPGTTYKLGVDHHFSDNIMAYIGYTTGFKSGFFGTQAMQTVPGQPTVALPVNPEKIKSLEGGIKTTSFNRSLRVNISAFNYDYKDMQVNAYVNSTTRVVLNAEGAKIYGVDLDAEWHPTSSLYFTLAASALHARYTSFPNAPFFTPRTAAPWGSVTSIGDASHNHTPNGPPFTASLGANYSIPVATGDLDLNGNVYYNSGFYWDPQNRLKEPSFFMVGGTVKWTAPDRRTEVALWARNLTNAKTHSSSNPTANGDAAQPREPRTFGVRLGFHY